MSDSKPGPDLSLWIRPGDTVIWGQAMAEPLTLTRALVAQRKQLGRLRVFVGIGASSTLQPEQSDSFDFIGYGASGTHRVLAQADVLDILPCHYSELPVLMRSGALRIDVVLLQVSPPDANGRHSLGLAHEYLLAALSVARVVIAEVNPDVPWVPGERTLAAQDFDLLVPSAFAPIDAAPARPGAAEQAIAAHVAGLVEDGATLQLGIGNVPEAVLAALHDRRDLGLHSGSIGDGIVALSECGALTNARKTIDRGVSVAGVLMGSARLRHWAHHNPALQMRGTDYTHHAGVLSSIDRLVAINSAIEVDLTGQINAEVAGGVYVGAVGGAIDFLRGAARSRGGLPIVALPATAGKAATSRIVARLSGPVSTPRADAGLIITEHGVADLRGQSLTTRVRRMLAIAAPEHREALERTTHTLLQRCGTTSSH
jgi:acyl-CoA hydrolase